MDIIADRMRLIRPLRAARVPLIVALVTALLVNSAIPATTAVVVALLVDRLDRTATVGSFGQALLPLGAFGIMLVLGHLAEVAAVPLEFLTRARIDGAHRSRVIQTVSGGNAIDRLESPDVQALIRSVSADPQNRTERTAGDGAISQLRWFTGIVGVAASCVVLARYAWWLIPLLALPAAAIRYRQHRQAFDLTRKLRFGYAAEMHSDVWERAAVSPGAGKDIRTFGFADWMVRRIQQHVAAGNTPLWVGLARVINSEWKHFLLVIVGLAPAYAAVTLSAAHGHTSVAVQTAVFTAGWSLFLAFGDVEDILRIVGGIEVLKAFDRLRAELNPPSTGGALPAEPRTTGVPDTGRPPVVRFDQVSFTYPGSTGTILDQLDLEIRPGELLAIVGMNGAGKSTLIKLLAGLYAPVSGRITADGGDIAAIGLEAWRTRISFVFQDFVRYPLSAADNVALGRPGTLRDPAAIDAAARDAGFEGVLAGLPNGWTTPLARSCSGGVDLSGGQWQQVVLARALYAVRTGARLLVLDEPTAHLDVRTEFDVFDRLARHRGDTTVVLISHRLSTVRQADRIVLLEDGRITESGSHDELIALGATYADMFAIQAERFKRGYEERIEEGELL